MLFVLGSFLLDLMLVQVVFLSKLHVLQELGITSLNIKIEKLSTNTTNSLYKTLTVRSKTTCKM